MSATDESSGLCIALTTAGSSDEAQRLARMLVERRLAACVNILPGVHSIYRWKGAVEESDEVVLVIKTSRAQSGAVQAALREAHTYDLPEFLLLPIEGGSTEYLAWLQNGLQDGLKVEP